MVKIVKINSGFIKYKPYAPSSDHEENTTKIDSEMFMADVERAVNQLDADGYKIVSVTPITSGGGSDSHGFGFGFSYTDCVIITAQK